MAEPSRFLNETNADQIRAGPCCRRNPRSVSGSGRQEQAPSPGLGTATTMWIHLVCPVFPPQPAPAGVMAGQLADRLAADGHDVTVFTQFPNRPLGRVFAGYRRRLRAVERADQLDVIRCPNWLLDARRRSWNWLLENITFGLTSTWAAWREGRPDVMLIETWPFFAVRFNLWLARYWKAPAVYYVKDMCPEPLEYAGFLPRDGAAASILRAWDRRLCSGSSRAVVISEGMKRLLCQSRDLPEEKVTVIADWVDLSLFSPLAIDNGWREEIGISPRTSLVLFAGTLGHVSGAGVGRVVRHILRETQHVWYEMLADSGLEEMGIRGRSFAAKQLSRRAVAERMLTALQDLALARAARSLAVGCGEKRPFLQLESSVALTQYPLRDSAEQD